MHVSASADAHEVAGHGPVQIQRDRAAGSPPSRLAAVANDPADAAVTLGLHGGHQGQGNQYGEQSDLHIQGSWLK